jgi:hypothetical protein
MNLGARRTRDTYSHSERGNTMFGFRSSDQEVRSSAARQRQRRSFRDRVRLTLLALELRCLPCTWWCFDTDFSTDGHQFDPVEDHGEARAIAFQEYEDEERILMGGTATDEDANEGGTNFAVVRIDPSDGSLDSSFSGDGIAVISFYDEAYIYVETINVIDIQANIPTFVTAMEPIRRIKSSSPGRSTRMSWARRRSRRGGSSA